MKFKGITNSTIVSNEYFSSCQELGAKIDLSRIPSHIAVIMDGNGRWARQRGWKRILGHDHARESVREAVRSCGELGVKVLSLFAFSTENWSRPREEVNFLFRLFEHTLSEEVAEMCRNNVRLRFCGKAESSPEDSALPTEQGRPPRGPAKEVQNLREKILPSPTRKAGTPARSAENSPEFSALPSRAREAGTRARSQEELPDWLIRRIDESIGICRNNTGLIVNLVINYGGKQDILQAVNRLLQLEAGSWKLEVTEEEFEKHLLTGELPAVDLMIRTSSERRLSNFFLWQSAYAEFVVMPVLWPDFRREHMLEAILEYQRRDRRFGSI